MTNKYTIYIPSKGRGSCCYTARLLNETNLKWCVVVEPQDYKEYRKSFPKKNILVLPKNNGGIVFARKFILETSISRGEKAHWQLDDDIYSFRRKKKGKIVKATPEKTILGIEKIFRSYKDLYTIGHRNAAFAFSYKTDYSYNHAACSSLLVKNSISKLGVTWKAKTADDLDLALQLLSKGKCLMVANNYIIQCAPHNKLKGGVSAGAGKPSPRIEAYSNLTKDWPGYFEFQVLEGGHQVKLKNKRAWARFKQRPTPKEKG